MMNEEISVIGFDLDLTLVDTRAATAYALDMVNLEFETRIDVPLFLKRLGPPIMDEIRPWIPEDRLEAAADHFRSAFLNGGLELLAALPGAHESVERLISSGGKVVVITSRRQHIAEAVLARCGIRANVVVGGRTGIEKASAMTANWVTCYLGDHPLDMQGAKAAKVMAIGVLSGTHNRAELTSAGADLVVNDLCEFDDLLAQRLRRAE